MHPLLLSHTQAWHISSRPINLQQTLLTLWPPSAADAPLPPHFQAHPTAAPPPPPQQHLHLPGPSLKHGQAAASLTMLNSSNSSSSSSSSSSGSASLGELGCLLWSLCSVGVAPPDAAWLRGCYQRAEAAVREGGSAPAESWVCMLWAAARLGRGRLDLVAGSSNGSSGGGDVGSSSAARLASGSDLMPGSSGGSGAGNVMGGGGAHCEGTSSSSSSSSSSLATQQHVHGADDGSGTSVMVAACGWLPAACARVAAGVGSLSGSSLGCVVWACGALLEGLVAAELQAMRTQDGASGADDGDSARLGQYGAELGTHAKVGVPPAAGVQRVDGVQAGTGGAAYGSGAGEVRAGPPSVEQGADGGSGCTTGAVVVALQGLAALQAAAYAEVQRRLLQHLEGGTEWEEEEAASLTNEAEEAEVLRRTGGGDGSALSEAQQGLALLQPAPAAAAAAATAAPSVLRPTCTPVHDVAAAPITPKRSRSGARLSSTWLRRAGLPLAAVLSACTGALQGRDALAQAVGLLPHLVGGAGAAAEHAVFSQVDAAAEGVPQSSSGAAAALASAPASRTAIGAVLGQAAAEGLGAGVPPGRPRDAELGHGLDKGPAGVGTPRDGRRVLPQVRGSLYMYAFAHVEVYVCACV